MISKDPMMIIIANDDGSININLNDYMDNVDRIGRYPGFFEKNYGVSDDLYRAVCLKRPKYVENYYPAINLIDTIVAGTSKLLDNHKSIRKIIIEPDNYDSITFIVGRIEDNPEKYMYTVLLKDFKWKRVVM